LVEELEQEPTTQRLNPKRGANDSSIKEDKEDDCAIDAIETIRKEKEMYSRSLSVMAKLQPRPFETHAAQRREEMSK